MNCNKYMTPPITPVYPEYIQNPAYIRTSLIYSDILLLTEPLPPNYKQVMFHVYSLVDLGKRWFVYAGPEYVAQYIYDNISEHLEYIEEMSKHWTDDWKVYIQNIISKWSKFSEKVQEAEPLDFVEPQ